MNDLAKVSSSQARVANLKPLQIPVFNVFPVHSSGSCPPRPVSPRLSSLHKAQPAYPFFEDPENFSPHVESRRWRRRRAGLGMLSSGDRSGK